MKEIIVKTQKELDAIKRIEQDEHVIIESAGLRLNGVLEIFGVITLKFDVDMNWYQNRMLVCPGNSSPRIVSRENSSPSIVSWENSSPSIESWDNSSPRIESWDNSSPSIVSRENSSPRIESWDNSSPRIESWDNSSPRIESRENSSPRIVSRENSVLRGTGLTAKSTLKILGCSVAVLPLKLKLKITKSKTAVIQRVKPDNKVDFFERHGLSKTSKFYTLYKRVSGDFKTQEGTSNETDWKIGTTVTHKAWNPTVEECGAGKFHACPEPYFCDDFRSNVGDRYIAIKVKKSDLYVWKKSPQFLHKVGFRSGKVLYECDRFGTKIEAK